MNRASFPADLEDGLNAHFGMAYNQLSPEWSDVFDTESSTRAFEEDVLEYGFGLAPERGEGQALSYDEGGQAWTKRYTHIEVALGFEITQQAIEDNRYQRLGPKFSSALARAFFNTKETYGASVLNNARSGSYLGGDGVSLLSTAHPMANGSTFSNVLATAAQVSEAAIEDVLVMIRKAKDDRGQPIALRPMKLIGPPEAEYAFERLRASTMRPGTADNDVNAVKSRRGSFYSAEPVIVTRMTDADAWGIKTDCPEGLKHMKRIALQRGMQEDFSTGNAQYKGRERYSFGWTDPRAFYGSMAA
jgi:hypothetical protein